MDYYDEIHSDEMHKRNKPNPMCIKDMSAKEAKEIADAFLKARENEDFKNIMSLITDAATHEGKYKIYLDNECNITVTGAIRDRLEALGYKVEVQHLTTESRYQIVISWG